MSARVRSGGGVTGGRAPSARKDSFGDRRDRGGFTLIELRVVIAIISILASLLLPALIAAKQKATMIEEISSARQLTMAAHLYSQEYDDAVFPGYVTDPGAKDDLGRELVFPVNARYPWRLSPYLGQSLETIYCGENRARLRRLRQLDRDQFVYAVSVYPSLGINALFIGGNETEFPARLANERFGAKTVVQRMSEVQRPSLLSMFLSARSARSGPDSYGYFQVTPPYLTSRRWKPEWSPDLPPEEWGFVAPRHSRRAVAAMVDGHVRTLGLREMQDMQRWCNTADRPDFTLEPVD